MSVAMDDSNPTATSYADLVDVLATTLLARLLAETGYGVNQTDATTGIEADSSLAFTPEEDPDGATERGRLAPAKAHRKGRQS